MSERQTGVIGTRLGNWWVAAEGLLRVRGRQGSPWLHGSDQAAGTSFWESGWPGGAAGRELERTLTTTVSSLPSWGGWGDPQVAVAAPLLPQSRHTPDSPFPPEGRGTPGGKPGTREGGGTRRRKRIEEWETG